MSVIAAVFCFKSDVLSSQKGVNEKWVFVLNHLCFAEVERRHRGQFSEDDFKSEGEAQFLRFGSLAMAPIAPPVLVRGSG